MVGSWGLEPQTSTVSIYHHHDLQRLTTQGDRCRGVNSPSFAARRLLRDARPSAELAVLLPQHRTSRTRWRTVRRANPRGAIQTTATSSMDRGTHKNRKPFDERAGRD